jgi:YYY domain-containing protein
MVPVLSWWLIMQVLGLAAMPLAWRLFRHLPDRGYAFARLLGLLLAGYVLWLGGMTGLLTNGRGAIAVIVAALGAACWALSRADWANMLAALRRNLRLLLVYEGLFLAVFALWAVFKAYNPDIAYTEKPMEVAFLNAILRSERFPPLDPWLSGFSISYYYFGYLLVALLTRLSGVPSNIAYNLAVPLLMALTVTGAFSVVYNLVAGSGRESQSATADSPPGGLHLAVAGLGAFFVAAMGNLEGLLELLHGKGAGSAEFWKWLDIRDLAAAPQFAAWYPSDGGWWWWRASRVINDTVLGVHREIIDEFPYFSFMLADLHPHVLALPFTLLALALALNVLRSPAEGADALRLGWQWLAARRGQVLALAVCLGALGFLNSWDFPTYTGIVVLAFALRGYKARGRLDGRVVRETLLFGVAVGGLSLLLYLPFYLTFQSQASGLGLVLVEKTRLRQYLVIFGVFLWALLPLLLGGEWRGRLRGSLGSLAGVALAALLAFAIGWWMVALLVVIIAWTIWRLMEPGAPEDVSQPERGLENGAAGALAPRFAMLLVVVGLLLTLVTEFAFIRDTFGNRMNTVFKFYYQAWVLLAIAGAYSVYYGLSRLRGRRGNRQRVAGYVWAAGLALLVLAASYYPLAATYTKANLLGVSPSLDGTAFIARYQPGDYGAIQWLNANVSGAPVILEAAGGEYSDYARVATFTGLPGVLGWGGHELQWRGNYTEPGKREPDIDAIYKSVDKSTVLALLKKYSVRYVIAGRMEREKGYDAAMLGKFRGFMDVVYDQDGTVIYRVRE